LLSLALRTSCNWNWLVYAGKICDAEEVVGD